MKTKVSAPFCIMLACSLMLLPFSWLLAALSAAIWHELCHYAAIRFFSKENTPVHIFSYGAKIQLPPMARWQELVCALAGPIGGFSLLLFDRWIPRTAICAAFHSLYNLLPFYPMDGGRALQCLLSILLPPKTVANTSRVFEKLSLAGLIGLAIYGSVCQKLGIFPLILVGTLFLRVKIIKMPCKVASFRVQ